MSERKFKTTLIWHDSRGGECECEVLVTYACHAGYEGDRINPPEEASVEIVSISPVAATSEAMPDRFLEDDGLIAECFQDWNDDAVAAEEYRAEQRAERLW